MMMRNFSSSFNNKKFSPVCPANAKTVMHPLMFNYRPETNSTYGVKRIQPLSTVIACGADKGAQFAITTKWHAMKINSKIPLLIYAYPAALYCYLPEIRGIWFGRYYTSLWILCAWCFLLSAARVQREH